ncbi:SBBP repeat-containing protein [Synechococcus sp. O70.2]|uniref:SBBP repeat-containing protein n=1 Tax=Synechococcus sp. O70.2 TaxID=2964533 RepID=UPI0039C05B71
MKKRVSRIALLGALTSFAGSTFWGACSFFPIDLGLASRSTDLGSTEWIRQFGTPADEGAESVAVDGQGNVWVAGSTGGALPGPSSAGGRDVFVLKYSR